MEELDAIAYVWIASAVIGTIALVIMVDGYLIALYRMTIRRLHESNKKLH